MSKRVVPLGYAAALCVVILLARPVWAQLPSPQTVSIVDRSDYKDIVQYSGTASFQEQFVGNQLVSSCGIDISAKNVSGKPIVLFIASLEMIGSHGGCADRETIQSDSTFGVPIEPEAMFVVSRRPLGASVHVSVHSPLASPNEAKAEIRTIYIQFADGSAVGDSQKATDFLKTRAEILTGLKQLEAAYHSGGLGAFEALLKANLAGDADWYFNQIRDIANTTGYESALSSVRDKLAAARRNSLVANE
jgi:hypothetical protein